MEDTNKLKDEVESAVSRSENLDALEAIRISELGKNGRITLLMKGLGQLGPAERRLVGKKLNELKNTILDLIEKQKRLPIVQVGHNRRFSPHVQQIRKWLQQRVDPLVLQMRVNAGYVPPDHWVHSESEGRSRIVGEMSHFIDLMQAVIGSLPVQIHAERVDGNNRSVVNNDNIVALLKFADGSVGSLTYSASGDKGYSREAIEIFFDRKTIRSQDFRKSERT